MKLKEGENPLSIFGKEFSKFAYCWKDKDTLWLSIIDVQDKFRRQGAMTRLLDQAKEGFNMVIIPTPSKIVAKAASKKGYKLMDVIVILPSGREEPCTCMVWAKDFNAKKVWYA